MSAINRRLSEEYAKIELPTPRAVSSPPYPTHGMRPQHRLVTDARYLYEKFPTLKPPGIPTAVLETLVADKRVGTTPSSLRPVTPTNAPSSPLPLPLPPTDVPLGSPRVAAPTLTKTALVLLERSPQGHAFAEGYSPAHPTPTSAPMPARGKEAGYKQASVLLSPTPFPVEKHRELPKSPKSVPIHATLSPTPTQVDEEPQEPTVEAPNGDPSVLAPDAGTDSMDQGQGDVTEHAPPNLAKDTAVSNQTMMPEPASEGTSVAVST